MSKNGKKGTNLVVNDVPATNVQNEVIPTSEATTDVPPTPTDAPANEVPGGENADDQIDFNSLKSVRTRKSENSYKGRPLDKDTQEIFDQMFTIAVGKGKAFPYGVRKNITNARNCFNRKRAEGVQGFENMYFKIKTVNMNDTLQIVVGRVEKEEAEAETV